MRYHYTLLKLPKSRTLTPPNAGKDVKQQELSFTVGGNAQWYYYFENSLAVSYKTKVLLPYGSSNGALSY